MLTHQRFQLNSQLNFNQTLKNNNKLKTIITVKLSQLTLKNLNNL
jgi:hypothetical protein